MMVVVNGKERSLDGITTVSELLAALGIEGGGIAVVRGGQGVPRQSYDTAPLEHGERLEIVRMVGGG